MQRKDDNLTIAMFEAASRSLDITPDQRKAIETSYKSVGEALGEDATLRALAPHIQPQGSFLLGTVVKPGPDVEFDVDATCRLPLSHQTNKSHNVYNMVFQALKEHGIYGNKIETKNRCVRVIYAAEYHIDMTPCVPNSAAEHAIHVPDRELKCWKPSNPILYAKMFDEAAAQKPQFVFQKEALRNFALMANEAKIDPLPPDAGFNKELLKRIVQLLKRHRDLRFEGKDHKVISIIITTLAARAYAKMVRAREYESIFDFVMCVVDDMPNHIEVVDYLGKVGFIVSNPAIPEENFADKWNNDDNLPKAFYKWHGELVAELRQFEALANRGNHVLTEKVGSLYGRHVATLAANSVSNRVAGQHRNHSLSIGPSVSLACSGVVVPRTAYYGQ